MNAAWNRSGRPKVQFQSQYYLYCIIFLIFDVEAIFLVPFAVAFTGLPFGAFIAILVFLLLLLEGLVWAWSKGCFRLGADTKTRAMSDNQIDEGLRSELQKRGIWVDFDAGALQLGPAQFDLAAPVRPRLLRDRNDRDRRVALRSREVRRRSVSALAAPGGF